MPSVWPPRASTIAFDSVCFTTVQAKREIVPHVRLDVAADDVHPAERVRLDIPLLHEHASEHPLQVPLGRPERTALPVVEDPHAGLLHEGLDRDRVVPRGKEDLDELVGQHLAQRGRNRVGEHDHTAVGGDGVGGEGLRVRLLDRLPHPDAARVRVLHDHARRPVELEREEPRGREVVEVVERERLPVYLLDPAEDVRARPALRVVDGLLVRVLAVGELEHAVEDGDERLRESVVRA